MKAKARSQYRDVLKYIDEYWAVAAFSPGQKPKGGWRNLAMRVGAIDLPNAAIAPNHTYLAGTQFYWDTYFTVLGLVKSNNLGLARGMIDNLLVLYERFGLFPARNSWTSEGRSQPPYLTRMAWEVYENEGADLEWMKHSMKVATEEYEKVWLGPGRFVQDLGLSRYHPRYSSTQLTVYESGWDSSTRFHDNPTAVVPVDLNCQLYIYEDDLLNWCQQNQPESAQLWQERMDRRRAQVSQYFWDDKTGFFYDYDSKTKKRRSLKTLAGFYPLWCGVATADQAARCVAHLKDFEYQFGLSSTEPVPWAKRQWDYPNGWAPLQYIVISGLRRYGYNDHAVRLTHKWLETCQITLKTTGHLWEKYDVVGGGPGQPGRYPTLPGFAWTNAVFIRLVADLEEL